MAPFAIITPLKAIRMLLDGSGVLVRVERWEEVNRAMTDNEVEHLKKLAEQHASVAEVAMGEAERLRQEVEHWKGMYEQANQQRGIWYERCQAAERELAEARAG